MQTLIPTQLFVGPVQQLGDEVELFLQRVFCCHAENPEDCFCVNCRKIKSRQHHAVVWISPESSYKIEDIDIIFEKTAFALDEGRSFFFVLEKAERLSLVVANKLLKVLEEPPAGYNFILMTSNEQAVLKTIVSRCHIVRLSAGDDVAVSHPLLDFFVTPAKQHDPFGFMQTLREYKLSDRESTQLADGLLLYFSKKLTQTFSNEAERDKRDFYQKVVEVIKEHMRKPPQSGSSDLFWRNLFLHFPSS